MKVRWPFRQLRYERDAKAVARGRIGQRIWNRIVTKMLSKGARKLYRQGDHNI